MLFTKANVTAHVDVRSCCITNSINMIKLVYISEKKVTRLVQGMSAVIRIHFNVLSVTLYVHILNSS